MTSDWDMLIAENDRLKEEIRALQQAPSVMGERARIRVAVKDLPAIPRASGYIDGDDAAISRKSVLAIVAGEGA